MTVLAVIPARWASTRFPGKPLALIAGRPMIAHVWERVKRAGKVDEAVIATDDDRILEYCLDHGMAVEMTSSEHRTGTDRTAEVARARKAGIYVNVQGDEPIIDPAGIDAVVDCLSHSLKRGIDVATGYIPGTSPEQEESPSVVQVTLTQDDCVLSLSRCPVPYGFDETPERAVHVGLYAFAGPALERFAGRPAGPVERAESIELLRFLEYGDRIAATPVPAGSIGVDHPLDIAKVEAVLNT